MRDLFFKIFSDKYIETPLPIFGVVHFILLFLSIGGSIVLALLLKKKSDHFKQTTLKVSAIALISLYIVDFFLQPFWNYGYLCEAKLPFHICTATGILLVFVTFSKRFAPLKEVVTVWAVLAPSAFMFYPVGLIDSNIFLFSYTNVQSYLYHTIEIFWGVFMLVSGTTKLSWKRMYQPIVGLFPMALWATIGQELLYPDTVGENFMALRTDVSAYMPHPVFLVLLFLVAVAVVALLYLIYHLATKRKRKTD